MGRRHTRVGTRPGTRLLQIERESDTTWRVWIDTVDYVYGTFLRLYNDGKIERVTVRDDDLHPESIILVRPPDSQINEGD